MKLGLCWKYRVAWILVAISTLLSAFGCGGDEENEKEEATDEGTDNIRDEGVGEMNSDSILDDRHTDHDESLKLGVDMTDAEHLVGTWQSGEERFVFRTNGTALYTHTTDEEDEMSNVTRDVYEWSLDGYLLQLNSEETYDGAPMRTTGNQSIAIVDDTLFFRVYYRMPIGGNSLDGTWREFSSEEQWRDPVNEAADGFWSHEMKFTVSGEAFDGAYTKQLNRMLEGEIETSVDPKPFAGTIRQEGPVVYWTPDTVAGTILEADKESVFGIRAANDVIVFDAKELDHLEGWGWHRME